MRIHTDRHTADSIRAALRNCQRAGLIHPAVELDVLTAHGSRARERAYEVQLAAPEGTPWFLPDPSRGLLAEYGYKAQRAASVRRRRNGGSYGASREFHPMAATWHEWGYFLAALFRDEPTMSTTYYESAGHFEATTLGNPYAGELGRQGDFLTAVQDLPDPIAAATGAA